MNKLENYDATSERVENASPEERFIKFTKITNLLGKENIKIEEIEPHTIYLIDDTCGFKLHHERATWVIYRVEDVVDMIVNMRNDFIKSKTE